ncbi:hypothetical protein NUU61_004536 [Penicillium alfredii]|uniref:Carrier domain-containing protein n=1 Tax=Penicillium alfredii TaxID=1506179 RepID=A0A9W9KDG1_9EURO|nr:uncharacterized protein NUU61_004536 [Penicillium alfredii]KAJ5102314.1 hypothetical protein NUU61_004536 [Penicillium alfredii]
MAALTVRSTGVLKLPEYKAEPSTASTPPEEKTNDLELVWRWNATVPEAVNSCVHDLIHDRAEANPDAPAVHAWDGQWSYRQLDYYASLLAQKLLVTHQLRPGDVVLLAFDRSRWVPVTMLATMKAGATFVALDMALPTGRLQQMAEQVSAKMVLTLEETLVAYELGVEVVPVHEDIAPTSPQEQSASAPIAPSSTLYIVFTSGSTGKPKAVAVSHSNFASGVRHHAIPYRLNDQSRSLHFASYSFDSAVHEILATLIQGGCICIPSDADRNQRLTAVMEEMKINWAAMTPTTSQLIQSSKVPSLQTLVLAGEACTRNLVERWSPYVRLLNAYGPAECAVCSLVNVVSPTHEGHNIPIGLGQGCLPWVVDSNDSEHLLPAGEVGELLIEGPIVGKGYLGDAEKTAAAFVEDPTWLTAGCSNAGIPGRRGRLYRTGDLVQRLENGEVLFVGRKDTQVKLRGQRIELEGVESQISHILPDIKCIVDVVTPSLGNHAQQLVAFLEIGSGSREQDAFFCLVDDSFVKVEQELRSHLSQTLPAYMIPTMFLPVFQVPQTPSGKTDRRRLRDEGSRMYEKLRGKLATSSDEGISWTSQETTLRGMWATNLGIPTKEIRREDNFFQLGGDSIAAMKLSGAARTQGLSLSVPQIMGNPILHVMATVMKNEKTEPAEKIVRPFSLIQDDRLRETMDEAAAGCCIPQDLIEDIYPCTPLQEGLMALSEKRGKGAYVTRGVLQVHPKADMTRLTAAWATVFYLNPAMRTRLVETNSSGLVQVSVRHDLDFASRDNVEDCNSLDEDIEFGLGSPLTRLRMINSPNHKERAFVLIAHHSILDGWQARLIMEQVDHVYRGQSHQIKCANSFNSFVKYLTEVEETEEVPYWQKCLAEEDTAVFPTVPPGLKSTWSNKSKQRDILFGAQIREKNTEFTIPTYIRQAWALICAAYTGSNDVVFGATVSGRNAPVPGIEQIVGPTIATVPLRVQLNRGASTQEALQSIHEQSVSMAPFEQTGLQRIRKIGPGPAAACNFQSLLVVQPPPESQATQAERTLIRADDGEEFLLAFSNYPLVVECTVLPDRAGVAVRLAYNDQVLATEQMDRILEQLEHVLLQMFAKEKLGDIEVISPREIELLRSWNSPVPPPVDCCIHDLIQGKLTASPNAEAVYAWDRSLTAHELNDLSSRLAGYLRSLEIGPEVVVPLFFEKSSLTIVTILAVLKSGNACVTLDKKQPAQRLMKIVQQTGAKLMLLSENHQGLLPMDVTQVVVTYDTLAQMPHPGQILTGVSSRSPAFLIFTSGSTGEPKGIVHEHRSMSSTAIAHASGMNIVEGARVLQFASPSFDVSIYEILMSMVMGACICVPSDEQRMNTPGEFAREAKAEVGIISPTAIQSMSPEDVPSLKTVVLVGEAIPRDVVEVWNRSAVVMNGYGPGECAFCSTIDISEQRPIATVGKARGCVFWITDPGDPERLAPVGAVGEIVIEGPVMARGYLNNPEKTQESFLTGAPWLESFRPGGKGRLYRSGDLGMYNSDGTVVYMGRRDMQVKLRGQRIELGEVESHLRQLSSTADAEVAVDVVRYGQNDQLTAFVVQANEDKSSPVLLPSSHRISDSNQLSSELAKALPPYMIPSVYLPVSRIPTTSSSKTDRKLLRQIASALTQEDVATYHSAEPMTEPTTAAELELRGVWVGLLRVNAEAIKAESNFFHVGGDSVQAMKLVSTARRQGRHLNLATVYQSPRLCDMAVNWASSKETKDAALEKQWPPFSLMKGFDVEDYLSGVCEHYPVSRNDIKDAYPAHDSQNIAFTTNQCLYARFQIDASLDLDRVIDSWMQVVRQHDILRTVFVPYNNDYLAGIVVKSLVWEIEQYSTSGEEGIREILASDGKVKPPHGAPLGKVMVIQDAQQPDTTLVALRMCHAIYDGYSLALYWKDWKSAYETGNVAPRLQLQDVLCSRQFIEGRDQSVQYWDDFLRGSNMIDLPKTVSPESNPEQFTVERTLDDIVAPAGLFLDSLLKAAWAVTLAIVAGQSDAIFFQVSNGRRLGGAGIENAVGPLIGIFPVRVQLDASWPADKLCHILQEQDMATIQHETVDVEEMWDLAGWDYEVPFSVFDHIKSDIESQMTLDGVSRGPKTFYTGENEPETVCLARTWGRQARITIMPGQGVARDVAERTLDIFCSKLRAFSQDPGVSIY